MVKRYFSADTKKLRLFDDIGYGGNRWCEKRVRAQGAVRDASTSNARGSSGCLLPVRRSKGRRGNSRSTTTHCVGTGSITFRPRREPNFSRDASGPLIVVIRIHALGDFGVRPC